MRKGESSWLEVARGRRKAATILAAQEEHRSCINRAYYAAFSKIAHELEIRGCQFPAGREGPRHNLGPLIENRLVFLTVRQREVLAAVVDRLYKPRLIADYRPSI
ncbi:hypothetical protein BH09SUM1_BH09SUM1_10010 [soil metagenome]